jgi:hypothetical protein
METNEPPTSNERGSLLGVLSFLSAVVAAGGVAMISLTSFTAFNPPGWLRIITMAPLPVAILSTIGFGLAGLRRGSGRVWAIVGLVLAGLSVVAFSVIISIGG